MPTLYFPHHPLTGRRFILPERDLPDIRWIAGGSCGGKTVISRQISKEMGISLYDCDKERQHHFDRASSNLHPALRRNIVWSDFFASTREETLLFWEALCFERMEMILKDLSEFPESGPILVDGVYATPEIIQTVNPNARAVFLFADETFLRPCYYGRESTLWMEKAFASCDDPIKMKEEWILKWLEIDADRRKRAVKCGFPCFEADSETDWLLHKRNIRSALYL